MKQVDVSTLIELLQRHLDEYGDDIVMIHDEYARSYKSFSENHISRMHGGRFVIECEEEIN